LVSRIEGQLDKLASFSIDIYSLSDEVTKIDEVNSFIEMAHEKMTLRTINKVQEKLNLIINKNKIEKKVKDKLSNLGYIDNGDGTIISKKWGIMWMKYTLGLSEKKCYLPSSKFFSGSEVLKQATLLNNSGGFAGYQDWYLPSLEQLKTLIRPNEKPAICQEAFPWFSLNSGEYICSSTLLKDSDSESEGYKGSAINFSEGIVKKSVVGGSIRLVRKL
jgi:hypothetical protein